jgi:hypothetical protein
MSRIWFSTLAVVLAVPLCAADGQTVATRMRNVVFHLGHGIALRVDDLEGQLVGTAPGQPPVFDDVSAYLVRIDSGRMSMTPDSLTNLMNNYVFAYDGAPLKDLRITIEGNELHQTGTLKKGVGVPFDIRATIAATPDGRIVIHPVSLKAAGFVPKGVLDFFGLVLERLIKLKQTPAVKIAGDDFTLDPERALPPPHVRGKLTRAWIENGVVFEQFGSAGRRPALAPPDSRIRNYMYYRGGVLKFGKLTMQDTDLLLVDANQKDPFDFSPAEYNRQLVAGYSKNTPSHGLIVYMPDLSELNARSSTRAR